MKEFRFIIKDGSQTTTVFKQFETYQEALNYGAKIKADEMLIPSSINEERKNKAENKTIAIGIVILCVIWQIMDLITL